MIYPVAYESIGKDQLALFHLQKANKLKPDNELILQNLAEMYKKTGEVAKAISSYQQVLELLQAADNSG